MASWEALQAILCGSREELVANCSVLASRGGVNPDFAGGGKIIGIRKGAQGTLVGTRVGAESGRPNHDQASRFHELFHNGTGRAAGRSMAMRTI